VRYVLVLFLTMQSIFVFAKPNIKPNPVVVSPDSPIHIVLDGAKNPGDCVAEGEKVNTELQTLHFPPGWRVAIMCTPVRWQAILQQADVRNTDAAFTRISERITILNGDIFRVYTTNYRHIMAHELAHIMCTCADEGKAEKIAHKLERQH
jgi:hypothetical protein